MDEETARKIADHCLEPVAHELEIHKCQQVKDRIKTQLIIAHRMGVTKNWEKGRVKGSEGEMKIEIITVKRKLSKSLINQMREVHTTALKFGTTLGYLINIHKNSYKTILIRYDDEFFVVAGNWTKGETCVYRKIGKWSQTKKFESKAACDSWWGFYQARMKEAVNQIYV